MQGIYKIENVETHQCYIGQAIDIDRRWKQHKNLLAKGKHDSNKLQNAYNKLNNKNLFIYSVVEEVNDDCLLDEREKYWIDYYDSYHNGYNSTDKNHTKSKNNIDTKKAVSILSKLFKTYESINIMFYYDELQKMGYTTTLEKLKKLLSKVDGFEDKWDWTWNTYMGLNDKKYSLNDAMIGDYVGNEFIYGNIIDIIYDEYENIVKFIVVIDGGKQSEIYYHDVTMCNLTEKRHMMLCQYFDILSQRPDTTVTTQQND